MGVWSLKPALTAAFRGRGEAVRRRLLPVPLRGEGAGPPLGDGAVEQLRGSRLHAAALEAARQLRGLAGAPDPAGRARAQVRAMLAGTTTRKAFSYRFAF